jgi:hypothetical protein
MGKVMSRRSMVELATVAAVAGSARNGGVVMAQEQGVSAGLGLTRAEVEALYGAGVAGQSFMIYTDPVYGVEMHIGYDEDVVDYLWLALGDEQTFMGTPLDDARDLVSKLLPNDARLREEYLSQDTPGSIAQIETARYTSRWLDEMLDGRSSILVSIMSVPGSNGMETMRGAIQVEQR